ncbi:hypothetical protein AWV79_28940 [Cupriavidus sp. UYMMa02A]|nr:hypothetical protein AWV79_28940 [Cupriavidus sp. UYMMa02A]
MARAFAIPSTSRTFNVHQDALDRILRTTRQEWMLDATPSEPGRRVHVARTHVRLPRLAARAFEAQIMAIRCKAFFAV